VTSAAGDPRLNPFLDRLHDGRLTLMMAIRSSRTTEVVRIAHTTGHHAILVDLEHSAITIDVATQMCSTAHDLEMTSFVRVPEREYGAIGRLLDGGAHGIIAPRIETVDQARLVTRACRFPPRGQRSAVAMVPHRGMRPTAAEELNPALDDATIVQILVETQTGIEHAEAICGLDGVDMLAIGANDLTAELGVPGRYDDSRVRDAIRVLGKECRRHGRLLMLGGVGDLALLETLVPLGVCPLFVTGSDTDLLYSGAATRVKTFTERSAVLSLTSGSTQ
jgi:2-keto-3-deoxy-L-rhamnonate aldolase RhmA